MDFEKEYAWCESSERGGLMGWNTGILGKIIDVRDGTHDSPKYVTEGYPLVTSKNILEGNLDFSKINYISESDYIKINKRSKVSIGDIIMPMIGTIGNPHLIKTKPNYAIKNVALFKQSDCELNNEYLYYLLISPIVKQQLDNNSRGGTQKFVSLKNLRGLKIPLPPLETQKRIVALLDKAQELIDKRKEQIALMDELIQSIFYDMFGDPISNPTEHKVEILKNIMSEKTQNGLYVKKDKYSHEGIEMVHMSDAFYSIVQTGGMKRVSIPEKDVKKYSLTENDLLLARRSLNYEGAAKPCRIPRLNENIVYESSLIRIRPDLSKVHTIYLYYYLNDKRVRNAYIYKHITKSTISGINNKALNSIKIILPPIKLQNKFADRVKEIEAQKQKMQTSLKEMEDNFNSIMQKAFKGEI